MSRGTRVFLILAGCMATLAVLAVGVTIAAVRQAGTITVGVHGDAGGDLTIAVPAALAQLAIAVAPSSLLRDARREIRPWLPATRQALSALEQAGDVVLVEIEGRDGHVRVTKRGRQITIRVHDGRERFEIVVPLATFRSILNKLAIA